MNTLLLTCEIRTELDVVFVRQRARQIAALLSFDAQAQTRISTAVSEIARNAFLYAMGGRAQFSIEGGSPEGLVIRISDRGKGILNLPSILAGTYKSATGMGVGLLGARRLMDTFRADTVPGHGTTIELGRALPAQAPRVTPELVARIGEELGRVTPAGLMEEIRQQNNDLLNAFDELRSRQLDLDRMYREVAEANRRMTDVNNELNDKADALERISTSERVARAQAEAAVATRDELLAIVSHDLRNPLGVIVTSAAVLQQSTLDGAEGRMVQKSASVILRSADRMTRLIADLLDLAQIQAGTLAVEQRAEDLESIVREVLEMLRPLAATSELKLDGFATAGVLVQCDRGRILQIVSNLVGNALKFTPRGGSVFIGAHVSGDEVLCFVRDTGQGIAEQELPRVFDRFWKDHRNNRTGIGLGLCIVKGLVEAHAGRIWVESTLGTGTTFFFTLPLGNQPVLRGGAAPVIKLAAVA